MLFVLRKSSSRSFSLSHTVVKGSKDVSPGLHVRTNVYVLGHVPQREISATLLLCVCERGKDRDNQRRKSSDLRDILRGEEVDKNTARSVQLWPHLCRSKIKDNKR